MKILKTLRKKKYFVIRQGPSMDWSTQSFGGDDEDDCRSISSESSGGGNPMTMATKSGSIREDHDIYNNVEIEFTLKTLPNADTALEILYLQQIEGELNFPFSITILTSKPVKYVRKICWPEIAFSSNVRTNMKNHSTNHSTNHSKSIKLFQKFISLV